MITHPHTKVNFGLEVLRRRPDGYHDLETLFVPWYGFRDTLEIVPADAFAESGPALAAQYGPAGADPGDALVQAVSEDGRVMVTLARKEGVDWNPLEDLTVRAYRLLAADFDLPSVKILLEKKSPVGAGLGGGSADAAYALRMLSELFGLGLPEAVLAGYAARLGSDCAFFLGNGPAFGEGRGERLTPFRLPFSLDPGDGRDADYVLQVVAPEGISVSTAAAYSGLQPCPRDRSLREVLSRPVEEWKDLLVNDFEKTVFQKHPELAAVKRSLYESGAVYASMSGSGSSLFAIYRKNKRI